jgi:hypothetical protein
MARKKTLAESFQERLDRLSTAIGDDLRLPSLEENGLGRLRLPLPPRSALLNAHGKRVFTDPILDELFQVLDNRFGGCMVASSSSAPPLWGLWHPPQQSQAEKDYLTTVEVLANPHRGDQPVLCWPEADPENRCPHRAAGDLDFADRMPLDVILTPIPVGGASLLEAAARRGQGGTRARQTVL